MPPLAPEESRKLLASRLFFSSPAVVWGCTPHFLIGGETGLAPTPLHQALHYVKAREANSRLCTKATSPIQAETCSQAFHCSAASQTAD